MKYRRSKKKQLIESVCLFNDIYDYSAIFWTCGKIRSFADHKGKRWRSLKQKTLSDAIQEDLKAVELLSFNLPSYLSVLRFIYEASAKSKKKIPIQITRFYLFSSFFFFGLYLLEVLRF